MATNRITVLFDAVTDKATRSVRTFRQSVAEADGAVGKMKAGARSLGDSLRANAAPAAAIAGAAALKFGRDAVNAASNLEESINAVNVAYGDAAEGVHELGENSVEQFGISRRAFNESAVALEGFVSKIGGGADTLGDLVGRATDFASVFNLDVNEALRIFQSTLAGETEPIRKFGKDLSAAAVSAHALEMGLVDSKSEMTEAIKVQARYSLLMEQTADTAGDFANTQDSVANQSKIAAANVEELQASIGEHLVPAVAEATKNFNEMLSTIDDLGLIDLAADARNLAAEFGPSSPNNRGIQAMRTGLDALNNSTTLTKDQFNELKAAVDKYGESSAEARAVMESFTGRNVMMQAVVAEVTKRQEEYAYWTGRATNATEDQADAERDLDRNVRESTEAIEKHLDAIGDLIDERRELADKTLDANEAELDYQDSVADTIETLLDAESSEGDRRRALNDTTRATDRMVSAELEAQGVILNSVRGQAEWTAGMLAAADTLGGPMAQEIIEHVARVNGIPEEKITEILAQLDQGNVDTARRMLDNALGETQSTVDVDVNDSRLQAVRDRISRILGRTVSIPVNTYTPGGGNRYRGPSHTGSLIQAGQSKAITAAQAAILTPNQTMRLPSDNEARRMLRGDVSGVDITRNFYLTINAEGVPVDSVEFSERVIDAIDEFERRNGPRG